MSKINSFKFLAIAGLFPLGGCAQTSFKKDSVTSVVNADSIFTFRDTAIDFKKISATISDSAYKAIYSALRNIVTARLGVDSSKVVPAASFTNGLGADSLDAAELIMEVEKTFSILIPDILAEKLTTIEKTVLAIYKISIK